MKFHKLSDGLLLLAMAVVLVSILTLVSGLNHWPRQSIGNEPLLVQARQLVRLDAPSSNPSTPQVVVGTPESYIPPVNNRYRIREDRNTWQPIHLIDTETGQETQLEDGNGFAVLGVMDDRYLIYFADGLRAYRLVTGEDMLISKMASSTIFPQIGGDWVAFGRFNAVGSDLATLFTANLQTREIITLTQELNARDAYVNEYFGISWRLVAWYDALYGKPVGISVYDLAAHTVVAKLTNINSAFNDRNLVVHDISPGETVVTWSESYGYDLVTQSYFRIPTFEPPGWVQPPTLKKGRITEQGRVLSRILDLKDGTQIGIRAPLLDATPSTEPCVDGQNLVQNGDLEDSSAHNLWQQSGSSSDLIINELPPNAPQAGEWAIRLGRYSDAQPTIQQTLNIPSGVRGITLSLDVRASSWDLWGGDQLQVDLIDPTTAMSLLETPVQWTNVQLATGGWVPLQIAIQAWPGIDTPLYLVFRAQTDWAFPTDFTIDNIRFVTSCQ